MDLAEPSLRHAMRAIEFMFNHQFVLSGKQLKLERNDSQDGGKLRSFRVQRLKTIDSLYRFNRNPCARIYYH